MDPMVRLPTFAVTVALVKFGLALPVVTRFERFVPGGMVGEGVG
jgi:hypothetical protein